MLYHYTDYVAFDGIIRCGELRLNNILNMNDASEMRLFMHGICKAVVDRLNVEGEFEKAQQIETFFQKELAKEFLRFVHSEESLRTFTRVTGSVRPTLLMNAKFELFDFISFNECPFTHINP